MHGVLGACTSHCSLAIPQKARLYRRDKQVQRQGQRLTPGLPSSAFPAAQRPRPATRFGRAWRLREGQRRGSVKARARLQGWMHAHVEVHPCQMRCNLQAARSALLGAMRRFSNQRPAAYPSALAAAGGSGRSGPDSWWRGCAQSRRAFCAEGIPALHVTARCCERQRKGCSAGERQPHKRVSVL